MHTRPTPTTPPVPVVGTWRNVTNVVDVPPGELSVTLREDGTGFLKMPEKYFWFFDSFTWTRENLNDHLGLMSLLGDKPEEPLQAWRFSFTFTDDSNVVVHVLEDGEAPESPEPPELDTPGSAWAFRRD